MTEDRTRADRMDEELERRRARLEGSIDGAKNLKLAIPAAVQAELDAAGRSARWVKADPTRQYQVTQQNDYAPVDGVEPISTRDLSGAPIKLMLMSKRKDFIADDEAQRETARKAKETAAIEAADAAPGFYADAANSLKRGSG
jgi:hypothetical protein